MPTDDQPRFGCTCSVSECWQACARGDCGTLGMLMHDFHRCAKHLGKSDTAPDPPAPLPPLGKVRRNDPRAFVQPRTPEMSTMRTRNVWREPQIAGFVSDLCFRDPPPPLVVQGFRERCKVMVGPMFGAAIELTPERGIWLRDRLTELFPPELDAGVRFASSMEAQTALLAEEPEKP